MPKTIHISDERIAGGTTCSPEQGECRRRPICTCMDRALSETSAGVARGGSPWLVSLGGTVEWSDAPTGGKASATNASTRPPQNSHTGKPARGRRPAGGATLATPSWGWENTYNTQNRSDPGPLLDPRGTTRGSSRGLGEGPTKGPRRARAGHAGFPLKVETEPGCDHSNLLPFLRQQGSGLFTGITAGIDLGRSGGSSCHTPAGARVRRGQGHVRPGIGVWIFIFLHHVNYGQGISQQTGGDVLRTRRQRQGV